MKETKDRIMKEAVKVTKDLISGKNPSEIPEIQKDRIREGVLKVFEVEWGFEESPYRDLVKFWNSRSKLQYREFFGKLVDLAIEKSFEQKDKEFEQKIDEVLKDKIFFDKNLYDAVKGDFLGTGFGGIIQIVLDTVETQLKEKLKQGG